MIRQDKLKAVVFDLDGVIIDSHHQMLMVFRYTLERHDLKSTAALESSFFNCMGMPLPAIFEKLCLPPILSETYKKVSRNSLNLSTVFPGIKDVLQNLKGRGVFLGVITGKDRLRTEEVLDYFSLTSYFNIVVCGDDPFPGKPKPDGLTWMLRQMAVDPGHAVLIGDSPVDIACAKNAGTFPIGVGWGGGIVAELEKAGAEIFLSVADLNLWLMSTIRPVVQSIA